MMVRTRWLVPGFLALAATLSACTAQQESENAAPRADEAGRGTTSTESMGGSVEVRMSSGPAAGTQRASGGVTCAVAEMPGTGTLWQAAYSDPRPADRQLGIVLIGIDGIPTQGGQSDRFNISVTWGDPMDERNPGWMAEFNTRAAGGGTGTATVERSGSEAVIRVNAQREGIGQIAATVSCSPG